ncbi:hypothetical protein ABK040_005098 [Willaertia magna]
MPKDFLDQPSVPQVVKDMNNVDKGSDSSDDSDRGDEYYERLNLSDNYEDENKTVETQALAEQRKRPIFRKKTTVKKISCCNKTEEVSRHVEQELINKSNDNSYCSSPERCNDLGYWKEKRIKLACNACRTAKKRCSGETPECQRCKLSGKQCVYEESGKKRGRPKKNANNPNENTSTTITRDNYTVVTKTKRNKKSQYDTKSTELYINPSNNQSLDTLMRFSKVTVNGNTTAHDFPTTTCSTTVTSLKPHVHSQEASNLNQQLLSVESSDRCHPLSKASQIFTKDDSARVANTSHHSTTVTYSPHAIGLAFPKPINTIYTPSNVYPSNQFFPNPNVANNVISAMKSSPTNNLISQHQNVINAPPNIYQPLTIPNSNNNYRSQPTFVLPTIKELFNFSTNK